MTLRAVATERRRPALPDLSPTVDRLEPAAAATTPAPVPAELEPKAAPAATTPHRQPAASRAAGGGARLDSLLRELTQNAPQVAATAAPAASSGPTEAPPAPRPAARPARRFPWRMVLGLAGAAVTAAVAIAGARGVGAALARPGRTIDGNVAPRPPANNYDAWAAAQRAAGEVVM